MSKHEDREVAKVEGMPGATGYYFREHLAQGAELGEHVKMFGRITLPAGSALAYHQHVGDEETYYILTGNGEYNDNGTIVAAEPGDVFHCFDGGWHCLSNTGDEDIEFIALITKSE